MADRHFVYAYAVHGGLAEGVELLVLTGSLRDVPSFPSLQEKRLRYLIQRPELSACLRPLYSSGEATVYRVDEVPGAE